MSVDDVPSDRETEPAATVRVGPAAVGPDQTVEDQFAIGGPVVADDDLRGSVAATDDDLDC
ncbi:hypothetical protein [Krasilnikovia sp. MM14-A1259]|uniref:hypothetical protein n=1 Tax=Krasilnikovia sp. MM14-A1259 TaxID=3373539 RepID=UPI00399CD0E4